MGTIADKLTYLNTTKTMLRDSLNKFGSNILTTDTFRSYDAKLNAIYDKLPKVTITGQGMTIYDVQNGYLDDFKMNGTDLYQNITTGKNYLNTLRELHENYTTTDNGITFTLNKNGTITANGTVEGNENARFTFLIRAWKINGTDKKLTSQLLNGSFSGRCAFFSYDANYDNAKTSGIPTDGTIDTKDLTSNIEYSRFRLTVYVGATINNATFGLMVVDTNKTDLLYEKYTGGIASPNPDYPQDINVVEDRQIISDKGKNVYDEEYELGYYNIPDGTKVYPQDSYGYRSMNLNKVKPNTEYKISINGELFENSIRLFYYDENKTFLSTNSTSTGKFITPNNCYYFAWHSSSLRQLFPDGIEKLMFSDTIYSLDYEPYYEPVSYNIDLHGENYFEVLQEYLNASNWETVSYPGTPNKSYFMYVEFPKNIVNKLKTNGNISAKMFLKEQGSYYNGEVFAITPEKTGTVDNTYRVLQNNGTILNYSKNISEWENIYLCIGYGPGITSSNKQSLINAIFNNYNISIVVGTNIPITYEEYYNYELAKMPDTNYKNRIYKNNDNWYFEENVKKVGLNGSENWKSSSAYTGYYRFSVSINDTYGETIPASLSIKGMNTRFTQRIDQAHGDYEYLYLQYTVEGKLNCYIQLLQNKLSSSDVSSFKTWLSSNNVDVWYLLQTPVTTQITNTTLINQLESLYLHTGTNIITVSNDNNMIPELEITRLKELEKMS